MISAQFRSAALSAASILAGGAFAIVGPVGTASAYLTGCSGALNQGAYTTSYCTGSVGGGLQRARQFCSTGMNGGYQYGAWQGAPYVSSTASCGGTVTSRTQQFTD